MASSAFERAGGFAKVRRIISAFYDRVLDSEDLQKHFVDIDMRRLIDHQTKFIASVMGGPASFSDDALYRSHRSLNISRSEFNEVAAILRETLEDFDLDEADIDYVCGEVVKREPLIVSASE
ncbi:MAG: group 1 truncated hemoglobin [Alphaproteobacteria bacterium]|jgi:hemoglobin|nr:group 1 truncated hemoglobin [Alphaproteobacteria bacterium]MDP6566821.1 group 1 truncated hemoglobin [Alphaproteobacteria bacterium]MDP6814904.1 group 1 truncated hemoglobin [Alphaproteobacteria bacterium]